ncbi:MAG: hypothetical protein RLZZ511_2955 [Cyanobacteriota bacterium]|jgi:CRISPR-associated protein Cmr3
MPDSAPNFNRFDIRDHIAKLTPAKGKNRYHCSHCKGNNLTIAPDTGKYQCWDGCEPAAIREAVAPWADRQIQTHSKAARPKETRQWIYCNAAGDPLIRVNRTDDGHGNKKIWQEYLVDGVWTTKAPKDIKAAAKAAVVPHRHLDALKAAAEGEKVYWVEGEQCVDRLWELGLPAITTIGGSDGYSRYGDYSQLLQGIDLVICPDRDQTGIKYANQIATDYPQAQWLYAFPGAAEWDNLPKSGGLDVVDWVASGADKTAIEAAVEQRRVSQSTAGQGFGKVVSINTGAPIVPLDSLDAEIRQLLDRNLPTAKLQGEKIRLRQSSALTEREFAQLWDVIERDYDSESASNPDEIKRLLRAKRASLRVEQLFPAPLADPLADLAKRLNLREELFAVSALTVVGSVAQNGTSLLLNRSTGYEVTPNLFTAIVAPASQRKSPVVSAIATKPLRALEKAAKQDYQQALQTWQERRQSAQANGEQFNESEPAREIYFFTKASGEAILPQAQRCPRRGLLNLSDELAGAFKSANQYRGGRGSDSEDMLSYYDGLGGKTLRVEGVRNDVETLNYGVLGGIQPRVLEKFLGKCEDSNGNWARYIFVNQPIAAATWQDDESAIDVSELLAIYYQLIADYDPTQYRLSPAAKAKFGELYNDYEQRRVNETNPALQAVLGKSAGRVGKIALGLHLIEAIAQNKAQPDLEVSAATIEKAALVAEFAIGQIRAIYADNDSEGSQSPIMARIIELSQRKGAVAARDVYQSLPKNNRPNTTAIRQLFTQLSEQGFGAIEGDGRSVRFQAFDEQIAQPQPVAEIETETGIQPGDSVVISADAADYTGLQPETELMVVRFDLDPKTQRYYATAMDSAGQNYSVWTTHLNRIIKFNPDQEVA